MIVEPFGHVHLRFMEPVSEPAGPPVLLLHPSPYSGIYFESFMPYLARDRRVIAIDTPGFGDSDPPEEPQSLDRYALALANAIIASGLADETSGKVDVIGYHTGSLLAVELAVQKPDLVRRLVLPGIPFQRGKHQAETYDEVVVAQPPSADGAHLAKHWSFASRRLKDGVPIERIQRQFADIMQAYPRHWWAYHGVFSYDGERALREMVQPALFVTTNGSLRAETEAAAALAPNAQLVHLPHLKHAIFEVAPGELAELARSFFDSRTTP